jgi:hypothetical protein
MNQEEILNFDVDLNSHSIKNAKDPIDDKDVVNKSYVEKRLIQLKSEIIQAIKTEIALAEDKLNRKIIEEKGISEFIVTKKILLNVENGAGYVLVEIPCSEEFLDYEIKFYAKSSTLYVAINNFQIFSDIDKSKNICKLNAIYKGTNKYKRVFAVVKYMTVPLEPIIPP